MKLSLCTKNGKYLYVICFVLWVIWAEHPMCFNIYIADLAVYCYDSVWDEGHTVKTLTTYLPWSPLPIILDLSLANSHSEVQVTIQDV